MDAREGLVPISWLETRRRLAGDRERVRAMLGRRFESAPRWMWLHPSYLCALLHRLAHFSWARGAGMRARFFTQLNSLLTGADIHPQCDIGPGFLVVHPTALTCSGHAGANFTMMPLSGIGMLPRGKDVGAGPGLPLLGDEIWMGPGSGILGAVRIGSRTRIEPGAGATCDHPPDTLVEVATRSVRSDRAAPRAPPGGATPRCEHASIAATLDALREDIDRYLRVRGAGMGGPLRRLGAALSHEMLGLCGYRLAHLLHARGWRRLALAPAQLNLFVLRLAISPGACIGGGAFLPHPAGLVFHGSAGAELTMYARTLCCGSRATMGSPAREGPRLGSRAVLSGNAAILGAASVGDDVELSFNAQVEDDVPAATFVASRVRFHVVHPETSSPARAARPRQAECDSLGALFAADRRALEAQCAGEPHAAPLATARLCTRLFRLAHHFLLRGHHRLAWLSWRLNVGLTGADIDPRSEIGAGLAIPYPAGISLHVSAGRNLVVRALAGAGAETALAEDPWAVAQRPTLGDGVEICEHASVHGPVVVGDGARLGPGCKVMHDVAAGKWLAAPPPRRLARHGGRPATAAVAPSSEAQPT